jgi:polysaccharide export outer membrane protein
MSKKTILLIIGLLSFLSLVAQGFSQERKVSQNPGEMKVATDNDSYSIGPEDVLDIFVWKETELSRRVPVRQDGRISLPLVGEIQAAGLTPLKLKEQLIEKLKDYIEVPNVTVTVMEANSFKVYVSGQVARPGVFPLRSETTIAQIIPMAGGFTEWANQRKILVLRKENGKETRMTINYKKIMSGEDFSQNITLKPGDTIMVPD